MKTVRRAYFYTVSLISMQMIGWGAILWLRQLADQGRKHSFDVWGGLDSTAIFVAFILTGLLIFKVHWQTSRTREEPDERSAGLRRFYLYANMTIWMATLVVVGQSLLSETLLVLTRLKLDGYKPWADLATLLVAGGLWVLHRFWAHADARIAPQHGRGEDIRRFYKYFFAGLGMLLIGNGLGSFISGLLMVLTESFVREFWQNTLVPPFSLLVTGVMLGLGFWWAIQRSVHAGNKAESSSGLRTLYLHFLTLVFALSAFGSITAIASDLLKEILGTVQGYGSFWMRTSGPVGSLLGAGLLGVYQSWLVFRDPEMSQGGGWRRAGTSLYAYLLATIGLSMGLVGLIQVITEVLNRIAGTTTRLSSSAWLGQRIVTPFVSMGVGLVVWLLVLLARFWLSQRGKPQAEERRSLWRRIHVCLFAFAGGSAFTYALLSLIRLIVRLLFGTDAPDPFLAGISSEISLLVIGGSTWTAFWFVLKSDEQGWRRYLRAQAFQVAVIDGDVSELGQAIVRHLHSELPGATVATPPAATVTTETLAEADVIVGSWEIAHTSGLADLPAEKVLVPTGEGWSWAGVEPGDVDELARHAAQAARQVADGDPVHPEGRLPTFAIVAVVSLFISPLWTIVFLLTLLGPVIEQIFSNIISQLTP